MNTPSLDRTEIELRHAVARGQISTAAKLIAAYGDQATEHLKHIGVDNLQYRGTCERVVSLLDWVRCMLEAHRSGLAEELHSARKTTQFLASPGPDTVSFFGVDV